MKKLLIILLVLFYPIIKRNAEEKNINRMFVGNLDAKISQCRNDGETEIYNSLFANQQKWVKGSSVEEANKNLQKFLTNEGFNVEFEKCISDKQIEDFVLNDRIEGVKNYNVNATPTIIINNKKFEKSLNYKNLKKTLEKLI